MKGILAPLALLAAILGFGLWNSAAMTAKTEYLRDQLQQADRLVQAEDWPAAEALLQESYQEWSDWQSYLHTVAQHAAAAEAEAIYVRSLILVRAKEGSDLRAEIAELRERLRLLADIERLTVQNIL